MVCIDSFSVLLLMEQWTHSLTAVIKWGHYPRVLTIQLIVCLFAPPLVFGKLIIPWGSLSNFA